MAQTTPQKPDLEYDNYTNAVLQKINYLVGKSEIADLSEEQYNLIADAIVACSPKSHALDIRGTIPFHFAKFYYVFLSGKDARESKGLIEDDLRQETKPAAHFIYWGVALWPFYVVSGFVVWILNHLPELYRG